MKKHYSLLSLLCVVALSFFVASCGSKKDETLVTEFNAKKTDADKMITMTDADRKVMAADHAAWTAKLDSVAKLPGSDSAKINGFKAEMKKHEDMAKTDAQMISDSIKAYENAKTENNDQLKAAIAGLDAQSAACTANWSGLMDQHKKLGADISAFLGGNKVVDAEPSKDKKETKTTKTTTTAPAKIPGMDMTKHPVKETNTGTPRRSGGSVIKQ